MINDVTKSDCLEFWKPRIKEEEEEEKPLWIWNPCTGDKETKETEQHQPDIREYIRGRQERETSEAQDCHSASKLQQETSW